MHKLSATVSAVTVIIIGKEINAIRADFEGSINIQLRQMIGAYEGSFHTVPGFIPVQTAKPHVVVYLIDTEYVGAIITAANEHFSNLVEVITTQVTYPEIQPPQLIITA